MNRHKLVLIIMVFLQGLGIRYFWNIRPDCPTDGTVKIVQAPAWHIWQDTVPCHELLFTEMTLAAICFAGIYTVVMACFPRAAPVSKEMYDLFIEGTHKGFDGNVMTWNKHVQFFVTIVVIGNLLILPIITLTILVAALICLMALTRQVVRHVHYAKLQYY